MRKITLFLSLLFFVYNIAAQNWAYRTGGIKEDEAMDICYDNSGNIISAGYFSGSTQFAPGFTLNPVALGNPDIYISKSTSSGQIIWAQKAGGSGSDRATSVKSDANGNIYITGYYYGSATFGSTVLTSISGSQDGFIAKLDPSGNFLWAKSFGGNLAEWGNAIAVDELDNLLITGQFQGSANFSGTILTSMVNPNTSFSSFDVFTAKYTPSGNLIWVNQGSAKYDDRGMDIITDALNNVYVCGQFSDTVTFQNPHNNMIMNATFIIKYNASGQEQWFRKASGVFSIPYSMVIDNANKIYVAGDFQGSFTYFGAAVNSSINGTYANKAFLMKIDANGNFIWGKSESSNSYVSNKRVALDTQQDPYVFGEFNCTMNEYSDAYGTGIFNSVGFGDLFITKYNNAGTRQWFKHYGGPRNDKAHGLLVAGINEPIMAGSYEHHLNIPGTIGTLLTINNINNGNWFNLNQPDSYCSAQNNYTHYADLHCEGYSDAFIIKGMDLTRNPYDYYNRSGTACNLNRVANCIQDRYGLLQCPDTIPICYRDSISTDERAHSVNGSYGFNIGPIFRYKWNNSLNDTLRKLFVTNSGYNQVKVTTLDGCYSSLDTVYVRIDPLPAPPTITDNLGINVQHLPWANTIHMCAPATITLTGGNIQGNSYQWFGNTVSTTDSSAIVNNSGKYYFVITNTYGCKDTNAIIIQLDPPIPTFAPKQKNDTVEICFNNKDKHIVCDSITNPTLNYQYPCVNHQGAYIVSQSPGLFINPVNYNCDLSFLVGANATGNYTYTAAYIISNLCVHDTIYFTGHVYIIVKPRPNATVVLNGNNLLCPGDTSLLVTTISNFSSSNITYTFSPNDSLLAYTNGNHSVIVYLMDTISGCTNVIYDNKYITIKPNPFIVLSPYNSIICPNDSVKLTINLPGAINYEWHGPAGLIPINTQSFYSQTAGFYHCIVTDNNGCVFTTNTVEIKQYATPYLISSPSNIICNNQPLNLHVSTLDSSMIVWNAPLSGGGATKVINNPGVYSCLVTMCGITTTLSINIIGSNPIATISSSATTVCPFDSVFLSGNTGMSNYIWQPGNHLGQNYIIHTAGTYTLEVTDIYGCTAKSTPVTVAFSSTVSPPMHITNDTICAGQTATLSAVSSGSNQLEWFPNTNSGSVINTGNMFITPTLSNQTTYYVASVSPGGCHSFGVPATVFIHPTSQAPILLSDTTVCRHDSLKITSPYIIGATYSWSGPGITSNNTNSIAIGYADSTHAGTYSLQVSGFGCTAPVSSVTMFVLDPTAPAISGTDSICENSNYSAIVNPTNVHYTYEWQGPGNYTNVGDSLNFVNANINHSGTYTITSNLFGCLSPTSILNLTVLEIPPTPAIISNTPCVGDTLFLSTITGSNYSYTWVNQNGPVGTGPLITIPSADTTHSGYYVLIVSNFFCTSNFGYDTVTVIPYPAMIVTADTIACDNSPLTLVCSSNYQNYSWNTGSTSSSINVSQSGTYWVTSQNGNCVKTDSIHVSIIPCDAFDVNVFTPNGDGANDVFMFPSHAIKEIHCEIINRWGQKVGEFDGPQNGWPGKNMHNGKECEAGTYFYIADIKTIEGVMKNVTGFVNLIR